MNLPERIPPEDLAYLQRLQEELRQAHAAMLRAEGALNGESRRLRERYKIGTGDGLDLQNGEISRQAGQTLAPTRNGTGT